MTTSDWQPIETAPKNRLILVWDDLWRHAQTALYEDNIWWDHHGCEEMGSYFTHWMLLPEPPQTRGKEMNQFKIGDKVKVLSGPFAGTIGTVMDLYLHQPRGCSYRLAETGQTLFDESQLMLITDGNPNPAGI